MKEFILKIEKTDSGLNVLGPIYYYYSIAIDGKHVGGGGDYSYHQILVNLNSYIEMEVIKRMPTISKEETTKWIEEGMWNREYIQVNYKNYLYHCDRCNEMIGVHQCSECHSDEAHCDNCDKRLNIGPISKIILENPVRIKKA